MVERTADNCKVLGSIPFRLINSKYVKKNVIIYIYILTINQLN